MDHEISILWAPLINFHVCIIDHTPHKCLSWTFASWSLYVWHWTIQQIRFNIYNRYTTEHFRKTDKHSFQDDHAHHSFKLPIASLMCHNMCCIIRLYEKPNVCLDSTKHVYVFYIIYNKFMHAWCTCDTCCCPISYTNVTCPNISNTTFVSLFPKSHFHPCWSTSNI